jgi:hypothetical protein
MAAKIRCRNATCETRESGDNCGDGGGKGVVFKRCGGCGDGNPARYCSAACQRADWPLHKLMCARLNQVNKALKYALFLPVCSVTRTHTLTPDTRKSICHSQVNKAHKYPQSQSNDDVVASMLEKLVLYLCPFAVFQREKFGGGGSGGGVVFAQTDAPMSDYRYLSTVDEKGRKLRRRVAFQFIPIDEYTKDVMPA